MKAIEAYQAMVDVVSTYESNSSAKTIAKYILEDIFSDYSMSKSDFSENALSKWHDVMERLKRQEPYQYITQRADFYGRQFFVDSRVLIPRPETEELAYKAISIIKKHRLRSCIDIGTGSGILPITIALETGISDLTGIDISADALNVAALNAKNHGVCINWVHGDILDPSQYAQLPKSQLVISNPPYITREESTTMAANVLEYEPHTALFVHRDALEFYCAIARFVVQSHVDSYLIFEISEYRADDVAELLSRMHFIEIEIVRDMQNKPRIISAFYPSKGA